MPRQAGPCRSCRTLGATKSMTAYCCPSCRLTLTFRAPENRVRQYSFPHSDDFAGCDLCGMRYCEACAEGSNRVCQRCGGRLHNGVSFEPKGRYRLPFGATSAEQARQQTEEMWREGLLGNHEYQSALRTIEQVAVEDELPPKLP